MNTQAAVKILWQSVVTVESSIVEIELSWAGSIVSGFEQLEIMSMIGSVVFDEILRQEHFALNYLRK